MTLMIKTASFLPRQVVLQCNIGGIFSTSDDMAGIFSGLLGINISSLKD